MKKVTLVIAMIIIIFSMSGCNTVAKNLGGTTTVNLPVNEKLVNITWKDSDLWYLTKPMKDSDVAETYKFQEQSNWGVFQGTVNVIETKE